MISTLYTEAVKLGIIAEEKQIIKVANKIARKMLLKNRPIEEIIEFTELTEKEIRDIEHQIKN